MQSVRINKEAFRFIKMLLSEECQSNRYLRHLPVHQKVYERQKKEYIRNSKQQTFWTQIDNMIGKIGKSNVIENGVAAMIHEESKSFLEGKITAQEAAKSIDDKVNDYLRRKHSLLIEQQEKENHSQNNIQTESKLSVYYMTYDLLMRDAVREYNKISQKIKIEGKRFNNTEEYRNKITTEILAGKGPDMIDIAYLPSVHKMISREIFYDMNGLISEDERFDISHYNDVILECGVYHQKRYFIPIGYYFPGMFYTTGEILTRNNIDVNVLNNEEGLQNVIKEFQKESGNREKFLFSELSFKDFIRMNTAAFVDYNKKKSFFASEEFISLLKRYREIYPAICPETISQKYATPYHMLESDAAIFVYDRYGDLSNLCIHQSACKEVLDSDIVFLSNTVGNGQSDVVVVSRGIGINANCKEKKAAFEFIKFFLSNGVKEQHYFYTNILTNQQAYEKQKSFYLDDKRKQDGMSMNGYRYNSIPLSKEVTDKMEKRIQNIEKCVVRDVNIEEMIMQELPDFLSGKITAEQAAERIHQKVSIYLNE